MKTTKIPKLNIRNNSVKILLTIFAITIMLSCKDKDELILETTTLQGTWVEIEPEDLTQLAGSNHTFTFIEDSFFLVRESWTDVVIPEDSCGGCPTFSYIKGEYSFDLDRVYFDGVRYLDSNYVDSIPVEVPAYNIGYFYILKSLNTLVLNPESRYESITLVKE